MIPRIPLFAILSLALSPLMVPLAGSPAALAAVKTETIEYKQGNTALEGYLAYDDSVQGKRPGILVVHDWLGVGDYVKSRARQLAELGFVAFAPDIYGKGVRPKNKEEASRQAGMYKNDRSLRRERAKAGYDILKKNPRTDASKMAVIGYCFGGTVALELARSGADLDGVVSFHGGLDTPRPEDARNIRGKVLALQGGDDPFVPMKDVQAFEQEMKNGKVDWQLIVYGGAVHAFTVPTAGNDPSKGMAYNAKADHRSWQAMKDFFKEIF